MDMSVEIRRAKDSDIEKIKDLLSQVLEVHHRGRPDVFKSGCRKYTDKEIARIIKDDEAPVFVYVEDECVLGYAFCILNVTKDHNILENMKTLYIDDLCVDSHFRGMKIGRALYEYVKEYAREIGCYNLTLNVWECNAGAKRFYEKMGLLPQKTVMEEIL